MRRKDDVLGAERAQGACRVEQVLPVLSKATLIEIDVDPARSAASRSIADSCDVV